MRPDPSHALQDRDTFPQDQGQSKDVRNTTTLSSNIELRGCAYLDTFSRVWRTGGQASQGRYVG